MPIYTRKDFPSDSIHQLLFFNPEQLHHNHTEFLEINTGTEGTTYSFWTEEQPSFETAADEVKFHLAAKPYTTKKFSQELAYALARAPDAPEAGQDEDGQISQEQQSVLDDTTDLEQFFYYYPDSKKLEIKPEYSKDYAIFLKEAKDLDIRPWYKRLFDGLAWLVANIPDFIIAAKDAVVWVFKWIGNKVFGTKAADGTNPNSKSELDRVSEEQLEVPSTPDPRVPSGMPPCCQQPRTSHDFLAEGARMSPIQDLSGPASKRSSHTSTEHHGSNLAGVLDFVTSEQRPSTFSPNARQVSAISPHEPPFGLASASPPPLWGVRDHDGPVGAPLAPRLGSITPETPPASIGRPATEPPPALTDDSQRRSSSPKSRG